MDKINQLAEQLPSQEKRYYMYYNLVEDDNDIVGMIAYCKYKTSKIEHIIDFKDNHGRKPTDDELTQYQRHQSNPATISAYRASALKLFEAFQSVSFESFNKEYDKKLKVLEKKEKQLNKLTKSCPFEKQGGFWWSVLASSVSTFLLGALYIILWLNGFLPSVFSSLQNILNK